jgi:FO synthase subunit 2
LETFKPKILKEKMFSSLDSNLSEAVDKALDGKELAVKDCEVLLNASGLGFHVLLAAADEVRRLKVGNLVTFVVNRNINFTNVCVVRCGFCAFSHPPDSVEAYLMKPSKVADRAAEAWKTGATEVCIQGGIHPEINLEYYVEVLREVKRAAPEIHIHAYSPMEVYYAAKKAEIKVEEALKRLREAGLDSMPGTAAEILDNRVRRVICPRKLKVEDWVKIVKAAHQLKIPTTSTIMYGHVENVNHIAAHLALIREIQKETGGFTEFIPLSFVHPKAPIYLEGLARPGAIGIEDLKVHAAARLMLQGYINNIQVSWVKLGLKLAQVALNAGANDLGGTLMEENISRAAGSTSGQHLPEAELIRTIRRIGRIPAQRTTTYQIIRVFKD